MKAKPLNIFEARIDEEDGKYGIYAISLVEDPAIMRDFVKLAKDKAWLSFSKDEDKQLLVGPLLVPNQLIYRKKLDGHFYFSADSIRKIRDRLMDDGVQRNVTFLHQEQVDHCQMVEVWIKEDQHYDKSAKYGFKDCPIGTLFVSMKVEDKNFWKDKIKTGQVKGFSIEGLFEYFSEQFFKSKQMKKPNQNARKGFTSFQKAAAQMLRGAAAILSSEEETASLVDEAELDQTDSGDPYLIFTLEDSTEIRIDSDGYAIDAADAQVPPGEYALADGNFIVIDEEGKLVVTEPTPSESGEQNEQIIEMARERGRLFSANLSANRKGRITKKGQTFAQMKAKLEKLEAENARLKAGKPSSQITEAGAASSFRTQAGAILASQIKNKK